MTNRLLFSFLFFALFGTDALAQTINAASCSQTDVQAAFNAATASTTIINIPSGTCHWTTKVNLNVPSASTALSVLGAGSLTTTGGTDRTIIIDDDTADSDKLINLVLNNTTSSFFRFAGITIQGGSGSIKQNGVVALQGLSHRVRMDHNHFNAMTYSPGATFKIRFTQWLYGVFDHNICDGGTSPSGCAFEIWMDSYGGSGAEGDGAWADTTGFGSDRFMFFEDNIMNNNGTGSGAVNDSAHGARYVIRHNTIYRESTQTHPTGGSGRGRGTRAQEVYLNTFTGSDSAQTNTANWISSGTALIWGNTASEQGYQTFLNLHSMRGDASTYTQAAPPNGWGYCGTKTSGTASHWDQNSSATTGWRCLDQPGTGAGDLLINGFPNVTNQATGCVSSSPCAWPRQALEPVYEWLNVWACTGCSNRAFSSVQITGATALTQNVDYYLCTTPGTGACSGFDGTRGVGAGSLSARPPTCTAGPGGNTNGVAYWATDQNTLYVCNPTNTWTAYYAPYTYPHPLTQGNLPAPPAAPTNLGATVQ